MSTKVTFTAQDGLTLLKGLFGNRKLHIFEGSQIEVEKNEVVFHKMGDEITLYNTIEAGEVAELTSPKLVKWVGFVSDESINALVANHSKISELSTKINTLEGIESLEGSVYHKIKEKIDALALDTTYVKPDALTAYEQTSSLTPKLEAKADKTTLTNDYYDKRALANIINGGRFDTADNHLKLTKLNGSTELSIDLSTLKEPHLYSKVKLDEAKKSLIFNEGIENETTISLQTMLSSIVTPDATESIKGKVTLTEVDGRANTVVSNYYRDTLASIINSKLESSTYESEKGSYLTAATLPAQLTEYTKTAGLESALSSIFVKQAELDGIISGKDFLTKSAAASTYGTKTEVNSKVSELDNKLTRQIQSLTSKTEDTHIRSIIAEYNDSLTIEDGTKILWNKNDIKGLIEAKFTETQVVSKISTLEGSLNNKLDSSTASSTYLSKSEAGNKYISKTDLDITTNAWDDIIKKIKNG